MAAVKWIDVGVNLTDAMFKGVYHGVRKHPEDWRSVLSRALQCHVERLLITGTSLEDSGEALALSQEHEALYCTVGCHPTRCQLFLDDPDGYETGLRKLAQRGQQLGKVVAIGECGLDYEREQFCPRDIQLRFFERQLMLARDLNLPLFLHNRASATDLMATLRRKRFPSLRGVVHSFDGSVEDMCNLVEEFGLLIGINGCSLRTQDNLECVRRVPLDRLLLETDSPWCDVRPTHASFAVLEQWRSEHTASLDLPIYPTVKKEKWTADGEGCLVRGRNEPCTLPTVAQVVAQLKGIPLERLSQQVYANTLHLFFQDSPTPNHHP